MRDCDAHWDCPITGFDCLGCEAGTCLLAARTAHGDPFRRGGDLRTDDQELAALGISPRLKGENDDLEC